MLSVLVVAGEGVIADSMRKQLANEGYQVATVPNGEDVLQFVLRAMPRLIILDVVHSVRDEYQLIRELRNHPKCMHIPIILLSPHCPLVEEIRASELDVDSYMVKPVRIDELLIHVRSQLRRRASLSPLTHLPGGLQLEQAIRYKLHGSDPWSVLYLDLDNFKAFNDVCGFFAGNDMILLVADICQRVVRSYGNAEDFVGHVGGDDFVIVTTPERDKMLCRHILARYKEESRALYRQAELARRAISDLDQQRHLLQLPQVSLSIGIVSDRLHGIHTIADVGILTAEAKRRAKQSKNNVFHLSLDWQPALDDHLLISQDTWPCNMVAPFE